MNPPSSFHSCFYPPPEAGKTDQTQPFDTIYCCENKFQNDKADHKNTCLQNNLNKNFSISTSGLYTQKDPNEFTQPGVESATRCEETSQHWRLPFFNSNYFSNCNVVFNNNNNNQGYLANDEMYEKPNKLNSSTNNAINNTINNTINNNIISNNNISTNVSNDTGNYNNNSSSNDENLFRNDTSYASLSAWHNYNSRLTHNWWSLTQQQHLKHFQKQQLQQQQHQQHIHLQHRNFQQPDSFTKNYNSYNNISIPPVSISSFATATSMPFSHVSGFSSYESRRKNATRESTSTLKNWLQEHMSNPYPSKGEKIMLAIITKMTLTQVSTWFANARRRLKKENKVFWQPKNKSNSNSNNNNKNHNADDDEEDDDDDGSLTYVESADDKYDVISNDGDPDHDDVDTGAKLNAYQASSTEKLRNSTTGFSHFDILTSENKEFYTNIDDKSGNIAADCSLSYKKLEISSRIKALCRAQMQGCGGKTNDFGDKAFDDSVKRQHVGVDEVCGNPRSDNFFFAHLNSPLRSRESKAADTVLKVHNFPDFNNNKYIENNNDDDNNHLLDRDLETIETSFDKRKSIRHSLDEVGSGEVDGVSNQDDGNVEERFNSCTKARKHSVCKSSPEHCSSSLHCHQNNMEDYLEHSVVRSIYTGSF